MTDMSEGLEFYNGSSGEVMRYIHPQCDHWAAGWIIVRHNQTGKWNTLRKATQEDLAELVRPRDEDGWIRLKPMPFDGPVSCTCEKCKKCKRREYNRKKILEREDAAHPIGHEDWAERNETMASRRVM